jgi:hypothetical protein
MRPGRFLQLKVRARPFGNARVKIELDDVDGGTRVTIIEDPADLPSAFVFQPLVHLITRWRNLWSLQRLAELAEGRVTRPGEEAEAPSRTADGDGSVVNPRLHGRGDGRRGAVSAIAGGLGAGLAGALAMSASTNAEMRLRGRPASDAPARTLGRLLHVSTRGKRRRRRLTLGGHLATSLALGAARGGLELAGMRRARPPPPCSPSGSRPRSSWYRRSAPRLRRRAGAPPTRPSRCCTTASTPRRSRAATDCCGTCASCRT